MSPPRDTPRPGSALNLYPPGLRVFLLGNDDFEHAVHHVDLDIRGINAIMRGSSAASESLSSGFMMHPFTTSQNSATLASY